ncbi:RluA family pseudouridine synthase [Thalassomonas sp. M1454]|uniref:RluA family pseudouridine synthase n=1 Tax=Thalassomonas sp. M1454 TaxID=2594477 RepID=UPI00117EE6E5|nr:RluA family pseudouridine synthase [Thalassomonas sp. M1454]TRX57449.1 RluA family pseudouridine synthase [Thalassomonas sp. M1454]
MTQTAHEFHVNVEDLQYSVTELLAEASPLSKQVIKQAMQKGCVWLERGASTQRLRRAKKTLKIGDVLHMYYNLSVLKQSVEDAILIDDKSSYSVWYKPYGMLCQGSKWSDHTTINRFVETHLTPQRPAFIVHRLDKATSGLIVLAHSKSAVRELTNAFEQRNTAKTYQAIVHGDHSQNSQPQTITREIDGKAAISHITCIEYDSVNDYSLVEVAIETGRKHQIRKHLASIGLPIVGDRLHGEEEVRATGKDLQLCAIYLKIPCPNSKTEKEYNLPKQYQLKL